MPADPFIGSLGGKLRQQDLWRAILHSVASPRHSPHRNSWTRVLRAGGHSGSSSSHLASGLDESDGSTVPSLSAQVSGQGSPALVFSLGSSSKVTCCLSCMGLWDWAHLLVDSPWHDAAWGALVRQLPSP